MESKLESYRVRKRRKQTFENIKKKFLRLMPFQQQQQIGDCKISIPDDNSENARISNHTTINSNNKNSGANVNNDDILSNTTTTTSDNSDESDVISSGSIDDENEMEIDTADMLTPENWKLKYFLWLLYFLFWSTCYAIAIELKFGTVYLVISALFGIYFNTRTGPKQSGEISAYSVFNENCKSIDGTLKAEQFEQELRYGSTSVR